MFFHGRPNPTVEVFLRQFGFPSPLLDWTRSPFVAAFFAMAGNHFDDDGEAAIYVLIDNRSKPSEQSMPDPSGTCLDRIKRARYTHRRHYLQQAEYTYCYKTEPGNEPRQYFSCHEDYFSENKSPRIEKVRFSRAIRKTAAPALDRLNINRFSLTGSLDGLVETLGYRAVSRLRKARYAGSS